MKKNNSVTVVNFQPAIAYQEKTAITFLCCKLLHKNITITYLHKFIKRQQFPLPQQITLGVEHEPLKSIKNINKTKNHVLKENYLGNYSG